MAGLLIMKKCTPLKFYLALARKASAFMPGMDSADAEGILAFDGCK
jgi:hypothetical protein